MPASSIRERIAPVVGALLAASLCALAVQAMPWWHIGEAEIGPMGARHCFGGECRSASLRWIDAPEMWHRMGTAVFAAGLCVAFCAVVVAGAVASGRWPRLFAKVLLVSVATGVGSSAYFILAIPSLPETTIGPGLWMYIGGIVAAIIAAVIVVRKRDTNVSTSGSD